MLKYLHYPAPNESAEFHLLFKETVSTKLVLLSEVSCKYWSIYTSLIGLKYFQALNMVSY